MDLQFLPKSLVVTCNRIVANHHKQHGHSELTRNLWHKDTMGFISIHEDLFSLLGAATAAWKIRLLCFAGIFGVAALAAFYNWWCGLAIIPAILAERRFAKKEKGFYTLIAALMLALEMVVNDVSGLGARLPDVRCTASGRMLEYLPTSMTRFLDIYLPRRDEIASEIQEEFSRLIVSPELPT
jgi:hypothetical protein